MNNSYQSPHYRSSQQDPRYPPQQLTSLSNQHREVNTQPQSPQIHHQNVSPQSNRIADRQNGHPQFFQGYANSNKAHYHSSNQDQPIYFPPPQSSVPQNKIGLIQPPLLSQEPRQSKGAQNHNTNINPVSSSQNQNQLREIVWGENQQQGINSTFWEQKFFMIYEKFQWFGERFEIIKGQYFTLSQQLQTVDSQEDWNQLKMHHEQFAEKLEEMFQELIAVADQNQQLINQRLGQQGQSVWERRYHELLSNFKALQEQNTQLQKDFENYRAQAGNPGQGQNYQQMLAHLHQMEEEYQKVVTQYNLLREEYENVVNQNAKLNNQKSSNEQFQQMRVEYQKNLQQMQNQFKNDYGQLQATCQQIFEQKQHLKEQLMSQGQSSNQIQHLIGVLQQKQSFIGTILSQNKQLKGQNQYFEQQVQQQKLSFQQQNEKTLSEKIRQSQSLKNARNELDLVKRQHQNSKIKLEASLQNKYAPQITRLRLQNDKISSLKSSIESQLNKLRGQYQSLYKQRNENDLIKYQIDSLQKKLTFSIQENNRLNQSLRIKNSQIVQLRNIALQLHSYQNILDKCKSIEKEKLTLQQISRRDQSQILGLKRRITQLDHECKELREYNEIIVNKQQKNSKIKGLEQQLNSQRDLLMSRESQINKFKQILQTKSSYLDQIEVQNGKMRAKIEQSQMIFENERMEHKNEHNGLLKKIDQLERRNKSSDIEFKREMEDNYQKQIHQLRRSNEDKLKKLKKLEQQIFDYRSKSTTLQKSSSSYYREYDTLKKKLDVLQITKSELLGKLDIFSKQNRLRQDQLRQCRQHQLSLKNQINSLTVQMEQGDILIKSKNNIINDYERQVNQFLSKITQIQKVLMEQKQASMNQIRKYEQQIENLRNKADHGTHSRVSSVANSRVNHATTLETGLIEQLSQQNTRLRNELVQVTKKVHTLQKVDVKVKKDGKDIKDVKQRTNIQERLMRFNERLQTCIQDNQVLKGVDLTMSQRVAIHEKQKRQVQVQYEKEIKHLTDRIVELEKQAVILSSGSETGHFKNDRMTESDMKEFSKSEIIAEHRQRAASEEVEFLKQKLTDQTVTNQSLIRLNNELKQQVESLLSGDRTSTSEYYKSQWKQSERQYDDLARRNKTLTQENRRLRQEALGQGSKAVKEYELKLFTQSMRVQELERENSQLQMHRTRAEHERANLVHDVSVYEADFQSAKSTLQARLRDQELGGHDLRNKCLALENEVERLTDRLRKVDGGNLPSFGSHLQQRVYS